MTPGYDRRGSERNPCIHQGLGGFGNSLATPGQPEASRVRACEELMRAKLDGGRGPKPFLYFRFVCRVTVLVCVSPPLVPVTVSV
jgi:hypothetical protein